MEIKPKLDGTHVVGCATVVGLFIVAMIVVYFAGDHHAPAWVVLVGVTVGLASLIGGMIWMDETDL